MDTPDAATTAAPSLFSTRATVSSLATDISELQLDGDVTGDGVHAVGDNAPDAFVRYGLPPTLPLWLHPACSRHIAKGNFLTLSRLPKTVEPGEWLAHQSKKKKNNNNNISALDDSVSVLLLLTNHLQWLSTT